MPRRRPITFLRDLGTRMRARRIKLKRSQVLVAKQVGISRTQLVLYETGAGHPPAATLHRIAHSLGTTSSALLGETMADTTREQFDAWSRLYNDPWIGPVTRAMLAMTLSERKTLLVLAIALRDQAKPPQTIEAMS